MKLQIKSSEKSIHFQVCEYIRYQYPNVIFNTDLSGIRLTIGQATQAKRLRSNNGFPDIVIYEQRHGYCAMFIELKKEDTKLFNKSGRPINEHVKEQIEMHNRLKERHYFVSFAIGFDQAKKLIDWYLKD